MVEGHIYFPLHILFHDWFFYFLSGGAMYPECCFLLPTGVVALEVYKMNKLKYCKI